MVTQQVNSNLSDYLSSASLCDFNLKYYFLVLSPQIAIADIFMLCLIMSIYYMDPV